MNPFKKAVFALSALIMVPILMGAFSMIDFSTQVGGKPTTLGGYGITDAASTTALSTHAASNSTHGCTAIASEAALTAHTGAANGVHGLAAGVAVVGASSTQTLTNKSISGEQINSGTVAEARIDGAIARDTEVTTAVSTHNALNGAHGCTSIASAAAVALKADKMASTKRESVTIGGVATTTVTFVGTPVPSTIDAAVVAINGLIQIEGTFTRTSNKVIVSTAGTMAPGTIVTLLNLE
jgi:hypothetical protein